MNSDVYGIHRILFNSINAGACMLQSIYATSRHAAHSVHSRARARGMLAKRAIFAPNPFSVGRPLRARNPIDLFSLFDTLTITAIYYFHYGFFSFLFSFNVLWPVFLSPVPCTACVYVLFVYSHYHVYYFSCVVFADGVSKCVVRIQIILHSLWRL